MMRCLWMFTIAFTYATLNPAAAQCGTGAWESTLTGLQSARAAIAPEKHRNVHSRAECAHALAENVQAPAADCTACILEYARLLVDAATLQRRGFAAAKNSKVRTDYLKVEFQLRETLHHYLAGQSGDGPLAGIRSANLAEAGTCAEILATLAPEDRYPQKFHELAASTDASWLGPSSRKSWAKAIRSCSNWDISTGENRANSAVIVALCASDCLNYLKDFVGAIPQRTSAIPFVPDLSQCSAAGGV